jgi:hypothetical protein
MRHDQTDTHTDCDLAMDDSEDARRTTSSDTRPTIFKEGVEEYGHQSEQPGMRRRPLRIRFVGTGDQEGDEERKLNRYDADGKSCYMTDELDSSTVHGTCRG